MYMNASSHAVIIKSKSKSKLNIELNGIGLIIDETPNIKNVLNMFDPIMFPTTKSSFFLVAATIETINSGREVPIASIVAEIKNSDSPNCLAITKEESITNFPPINKAIIPPKIISEIINLECLIGSSASGIISFFPFFPIE